MPLCGDSWNKCQIRERHFGFPPSESVLPLSFPNPSLSPTVLQHLHKSFDEASLGRLFVQAVGFCATTSLPE